MNHLVSQRNKSSIIILHKDDLVHIPVFIIIRLLSLLLFLVQLLLILATTIMDMVTMVDMAIMDIMEREKLSLLL